MNYTSFPQAWHVCQPPKPIKPRFTKKLLPLNNVRKQAVYGYEFRNIEI